MDDIMDDIPQFFCRVHDGFTTRKTTKEAKELLLLMPHKTTRRSRVFEVDATAKCLGAGVYKLVFSVRDQKGRTPEEAVAEFEAQRQEAQP